MSAFSSKGTKRRIGETKMQIPAMEPVIVYLGGGRSVTVNWGETFWEQCKGLTIWPETTQILLMACSLTEGKGTTDVDAANLSIHPVQKVNVGLFEQNVNFEKAWQDTPYSIVNIDVRGEQLAKLREKSNSQCFIASCYHKIDIGNGVGTLLPCLTHNVPIRRPNSAQSSLVALGNDLFLEIVLEPYNRVDCWKVEDGAYLLYRVDVNSPLAVIGFFAYKTEGYKVRNVARVSRSHADGPKKMAVFLAATKMHYATFSVPSSNKQTMVPNTLIHELQMASFPSDIGTIIRKVGSPDITDSKLQRLLNGDETWSEYFQIGDAKSEPEPEPELAPVLNYMTCMATWINDTLFLIDSDGQLWKISNNKAIPYGARQDRSYFTINCSSALGCIEMSWKTVKGKWLALTFGDDAKLSRVVETESIQAKSWRWKPTTFLTESKSKGPRPEMLQFTVSFVQPASIDANVFTESKHNLFDQIPECLGLENNRTVLFYPSMTNEDDVMTSEELKIEGTISFTLKLPERYRFEMPLPDNTEFIIVYDGYWACFRAMPVSEFFSLHDNTKIPNNRAELTVRSDNETAVLVNPNFSQFSDQDMKTPNYSASKFDQMMKQNFIQPKPQGWGEIARYIAVAAAKQVQDALSVLSEISDERSPLTKMVTSFDTTGIQKQLNLIPLAERLLERGTQSLSKRFKTQNIPTTVSQFDVIGEKVEMLRHLLLSLGVIPTAIEQIILTYLGLDVVRRGGGKTLVQTIMA